MDNLKFNLYRGKVISLNDEDKKGRIQVKLLPEMKDIADSKCPWFPPLEGNSSDNELKNNPPEIGSLIFVLADNLFYHRYYTNFKYNIPGKFDYSKIENLLNNIDGLDTEYQNIIFELYQDGGLSFHNRNDGSHGYYHSSGSYFLINSDGEFIVSGQSSSNFKLDKNGEYLIEGQNGSTLVLNSSGEFLANNHLKVTV